VCLSLLAHGAAAVTAGTIVHLRGPTALAPAPTRLASQVALTEIELVPAPPLPGGQADADDEEIATPPEVPRPAMPVRRHAAGSARVRAQTAGPATAPVAPLTEISAAATSPAPASEQEAASPPRFALAVGTIGNVAVVSPSSKGPRSGPPKIPAGAGHGSAAGELGSAGEVVPEGEVAERAQLVSSGPLLYPAAARRAELEADVALELVVGLDGRVVSARVLRPAGYGLDEEAVRAVGAYLFSPARRDGRPVRVRMPWTVQFRLR